MKTHSYPVHVHSPHDSHKKFKFPNFPESVRIRFGTVKSRKKIFDIEFNTVKAIKRCMNKVAMKIKFHAARVSSPKFYFAISNEDMLPLMYKKFKHSMGEGQEVVDDYGRAVVLSREKEGYFEEIVTSDREFRVHVADGKVIHVDEKILRSVNHEPHQIKNLANGYIYLKPLRKYPKRKLHRQCVNAVKCLGLSFGAVDVGLNSSVKKVFVFEVNSAMGMRTVTRKAYNEAFIGMIERRLA